MTSNTLELPPGLGPDPPAAAASGIDPNESLRPAKQAGQPRGPKLPAKKRTPDRQELYCPTEKLPRTSQSRSASGGSRPDKASEDSREGATQPGRGSGNASGGGRNTQPNQGLGASSSHSGRPGSVQAGGGFGGPPPPPPPSGGAAISQPTTRGAANLHPAAGGAAISQRATGGAPSSQPAKEVNPVLDEVQILELAIISNQEQLLEKVGQLPGAPECRSYLKEFIRATETNLEKFKRKALREAKQREAASARGQSLEFRRQAQEFERQAQELARQAQEAKARWEAAAGLAKQLEQDRAAIGDSSSREGTPEAGPPTR
jgi:hypothetical protein